MSRARLWLGSMVALGLAIAISRVAVHGAAPGLPAASDTAITSRSIAFFESRLAQDPGNFMIAGQLVARYMLRFQVSANLADVRRAESLARSVLPLVSDTGGAYARLGAVYLTQHKFAAAYDAARRGVAWNPGNQGALGVLFDAAVATGRYAVAESTLTKLRPGRLPYQFRAAHMLSMQGRMAGAYPDLYLRLAEVHRAVGEPAVAEQFERQFLAVARAPDAEALYAHPLALYYASSPVTIDTALAIARRDVARRPAVESYDVLSWVLFRREDMAAALAASDQARRWGTPTPTMDFHRARILEALGRTAESAALLKPVLAQPSLLEPGAAWELRASHFLKGVLG